MRAIEAHAIACPEWLAELWRWVLHLAIVRGYRTQTTVATYARTLSAFVPWVIARGLDYTDLPLPVFDDWLKSLYIERRNSAGYRRRHLNALRSFYDWRATRGYGRNCTDGLRGPAKSRKMPRKYTRQQLRDLISASRKGVNPIVCQRDECMILLLLATGLRREEIATLRVDQVQISNRTGRILVEGKGAKERIVPIEGPVVQQLIRWLDTRSNLDGLRSDTVFVVVGRGKVISQQGMTLRTVEHIIRRAARRARMSDWGVHRFRVTYATQLYDDGIDLERIRILMGHESIETTRGYVIVSDAMNRIRLKSHHQHDVLGTRPEGMPRWAEKLESQGKPNA